MLRTIDVRPRATAIVSTANSRPMPSPKVATVSPAANGLEFSSVEVSTPANRGRVQLSEATA